MLEPADARLVERDPVLPGLAVLLDNDAFAERLRRLCPGSAILGVRAIYLRYKPRTSCLVAYDVELEGARTRVYARCHRDDAPGKLDAAVQRLEVTGALGFGLLADPETASAIFEFPNDYEIRGLRKLFEPEKAQWRIRRILPGHRHLRQARPELLRYKPERRFVGTMSGPDGPRVVIRLYRDGDFEHARERAIAFHDAGVLRVPKVVGESSRYAAVAHEWVEGEPLSDALAGAQALEAASRVGEAVFALHGQRPRLGRFHAAEDHARVVHAAAAAVAACDPALGARATALAESLSGAIVNHRWRSRAVHGDLTPDQVLLDAERVTILDYDHAGYGDPCLDVGAMTAGLWAIGDAGRITPHVADQAAGAFAASYWRAAQSPEPSDLHVFIAASLMLLAPEPFRFRERGWLDRTDRVLDAAERTLARAHVGV